MNKLLKIFIFCFAFIALTSCYKNNDYNEPTTDTPSSEDTSDTPSSEDTSEEEKFSFIFKGTHCKADNLNEYDANEQVSIIITPDQNYSFNEDIIVTGVNQYQFIKDTGVLTLTMTNDVTVTCVCSNALTRSVTFNFSHVSALHEDDYINNSFIGLVLVPDDGYKLPEQKDIELINAEISYYNPTLGQLSFFITDNATITINAIRIICEVETEIVNATIDGINNNNYFKNDICAGKITPKKQYILPSSIIIEGDSVLNSYDSLTGEFKIVIGSTCKIRVAAIYSPVSVTYSTISTNCTISKTKNYNIYDEFRETIVPNNHYLLPELIEVSGLEDGYSYNSKTGVISGRVKGDIQIIASCIADESQIAIFTFNGTDCSANNTQGLFLGDNFNTTIKANDDYVLPDAIDVIGLENYIYNKSTGEVSGVISANEISITCVANEILNPVTFSFTGEHCTCNALSQYSEKDEIEIKITPNFAYELPSTYEQTGMTVTSYDSNTGILKAIINSNATLVINAIRITTSYSYSVIAENCEQNFSGSEVYGNTVELTVEPMLTYILPTSITSSSGCIDINYDSQTGKLSFVVIGNVEIKLSGIYSPKDFTFSLFGEHVTCDAPLTLVEGSDFSCYLSADEMYALPENIEVTGLSDLYYHYISGLVSGTVIGNVSITCNCVFDASDYMPVVVNCTNCKVLNIPSYVKKGSFLDLECICDDGYCLKDSSVELISGANVSQVNSLIVSLMLDYSDDVCEINIVAFVAEKPIKVNVEHCSIYIVEGDVIGNVGLAKFSTDEGYILPNSITYEGIELITYNPEIKIMTFRRLASTASISVSAIPGQLTYDSTMTTEKFDELLYFETDFTLNPPIINFGINPFLNVTATAVRNISLGNEKITTDNDVVFHKTNYNYASNVYKKAWDYSVLNDIYKNPYDGIHYYYEDGLGWKCDTDENVFSPLYSAFQFRTNIDIDKAIYDTENRCYTAGGIQVPTSLYFKDGKLVAGLILYSNHFIYVEYSDYGTTEVEEYDVPTEFYNVTVNKSYYISIDSDISFEYEKGYKLEIKLTPWYDLMEVSSIDVEGLSNWSYDYETSILTGVVVSDVIINIETKEKSS